KRLALAAEGDFVINLYNPRSKGRPNNIVKAREIFLQYKSPQTPVGIVENIGREGQRVLISDLEKMPIEEINMFSTVIVGNSRTYVENGRMITPRGYLEVKEDND
ncbi:MAG: cobalt-precorrin-3B C(17)-methyltransferase, partial [Clostridiales bacterium]